MPTMTRGTLSVLPTITPVAEHKHVRKHQQERAALDSRLVKAQERAAALVAQRDRIRQDAKLAGIALHLETRGKDESVAPVAHTAAIDGEIVEAQADLAALESAIEMHDRIAHGVRAQIATELRAEILAMVRASLTEMAVIGWELHARNLELATLANHAPDLLVPNPGYLEMWLTQCGALTGNK